jgi:uncharacterized damage-inducible protein DinB
MNGDLASLYKSSIVSQLDKLHRELLELVDPLTEAQFWSKPLDPGNSVGHLILHLTGNLNWFVGANLGGTGYVRDRDREFTEAAPPVKTDALAQLAEAIATSQVLIGSLTPEQLVSPHPETRFGTVTSALIHLTAHFALHRGQISYISRIVKKTGG